MFNKIEKPTTSEFVIQQILEAIRRQELNTGEKLPTEREMAETFGVSRPVIREGVSVLCSLGIIEKTWGQGYYVVKDLNSSILNNSFKYLFFSKEKEIRDLIDARKTIECQLAYSAAMRRTDEHLTRMKKCIDELDACPEDSPERVEIDYSFHLIIGEAADNKILQGLLQALQGSILEVMKAGAYEPEALSVVNKEHKKLLEAISECNKDEARLVMEEHLSRIEERHIAKLKKMRELDYLSK